MSSETDPTLPVDDETLRALVERSLGGPLSKAENGDPEATIRSDPLPTVATDPARTATFDAGDPNGGFDLQTESTTFEVMNEVGRGGMGIVFCARQNTLQREVALKRVTPEYRRNDLLRQHFVAEACVTAALDHPNIVPVHELGRTADGELFMAMKLVKGRAWKDLLHPDRAKRQGAEGADLVRHLEILLAVCNAVAFAHSRGVVHCDLKPDNVMVGAFGEILVMDWGIAVSIHDSAPQSGIRHRRSVSSTAGTPAYMAPELAEGRGGDVAPHTDVYLLGSILCEILTGRPPHRGDSLFDVVKAASSSTPPELPDDVHEELKSICLRAMAQGPADRTQTAEIFGRELKDYLAHRESIVLSAAASESLKTARSASSSNARFTALSRAIAGFGQARILWSENPEAIEGEEIAQRALAESERAARRLRRLLGAAVVVIVGGLSIGFLLVQQEKNRADEEASLKSKALDDVTRLSDTKNLEDLIEEAGDLWPAHPEMKKAMVAWQERASNLVSRIAQHHETLAALKARALPWSRKDREADVARMQERIEGRTKLIADFGKDLEDPDNTELSNERIRAKQRYHEEQLLLDKGRLNDRATFRFGDKSLEWQYDLLTNLIADLEEFRDKPFGPWQSMARRLKIVDEIEKATLLDPSESWKAAAAEVASDERFEGFTLEPQIGLIPLGADPRSKLQEFLVWQSHRGARPQRNEQGRFEITADTGIILVLLPGGSFMMGAQNEDEDALHYDPLAGRDEGPVHEISLDPFMMSKFEVTQGQWKRATGEEPAEYGPERSEKDQPHDLRHPIENISFWAANRVAKSFGLQIPTEAQWEYACRAGTDTPWWMGADAALFTDTCNIADEGSRSKYSPSWEFERGWNDGHAAHAPVGTFAPNAFGLHEVHGNVAEWCLDDYGNYENPIMPGTGEHDAPNDADTVIRGGHYVDLLDTARSSAREASAPSNYSLSTGVRFCFRISGKDR